MSTVKTNNAQIGQSLTANTQAAYMAHKVLHTMPANRLRITQALQKPK